MTRQHALDFSNETSRTKQSHADGSNINNIIAKYQLTGQLPPPSQAIPHYGDFSNVDDYQAAINQVQSADEAFMALPASIRDRMDNNPATLMAFLEDPANVEEAQELGIIAKPPAPTAPAIPVPNPPDPPAPPASPIAGGE